MNEATAVAMATYLWTAGEPIRPEQLGRAMDEAAGLVPLPVALPAERAVPLLPWSTYAAMLRGL